MSWETSSGQGHISAKVKNMMKFMLEKKDKRRLYQLIDMYLTGVITTSVFCDEYYYCYDLELDNTTLSDLESYLFADLGTVVGRFSPYEEDHLGLPHGFYTEAELRQKVIETKKNLQAQNPRSA